MSQTLGSGFDDLEKSLISPELDGAIAQGIEATVALDHYQRRENEQPLLVDVTLAANEAQRSFLEIEPRKGSGMDELVHECSRLTALVSVTPQMEREPFWICYPRDLPKLSKMLI